MTALINDEIINRINESTNIVDLISDYIELKKSGVNYLGLCPFHNEKTPSFSVSEAKQFYHCFGCGVGGDSIDFIMRIENLPFIEAVKLLAEKNGIELNEQTDEDIKRIEEQERFYLINRDAARYFFDNLKEKPYVKEYLKNRGIEEKIINAFGIGYALDSWDGLLKFLKSRNYTEEEIFDAGLIGRRKDNTGYYDKFRNRVIFPIINTRDKVIGFGGRVMGDEMPKYLNSQDTKVFLKGNNLYGLNLINKLKNRDRILLVEGYMDVIALYSNGIKYSVASLGTALTENQCKLLKRFGREIYICYDSDDAGRKATSKAFELLKSLDIEAKAIVLPEGYDPDDYIKDEGIEGFNYLLNRESKNHLEYNIYINKLKYNLSVPEDKINFTKEIATMIKKLKSPIEREVYIDTISMDTGISVESINEEINKNQENWVNNNQDEFYIKKIPRKETVRLEPGYIQAEKTLLKYSLIDRRYFNNIIENMENEDFINREIIIIFDKIKSIYLEDEDRTNILIKELELENSDFMKILDDISLIDINLIEKKNEAIIELVNLIKKTKLEIKRDEIRNELKNAERYNDITELSRLSIELIEINKMLKN